MARRGVAVLWRGRAVTRRDVAWRGVAVADFFNRRQSAAAFPGAMKGNA